MKKRSRKIYEVAFESGELYLFHRTDPGCPRQGSLYGIYDKLIDNRIRENLRQTRPQNRSVNNLSKSALQNRCGKPVPKIAHGRIPYYLFYPFPIELPWGYPIVKAIL